MSDICNVVVVLKPSRFNVLKEALKGEGLVGMTVSRVEGCGLQGGRIEYYRGNEIEIDLLQKTKVEMIVPSDKVERIVKIVEDALHTGTQGDGKIFVYDVNTVVRISNHSRGLNALDSDY